MYNSTMNIRKTVYAALFTALIIIGGYITVPVGPVPIVLTDMFVMATGIFLGWAWGMASVGLFLFLGAIGMPVFAGGRAGLAVLFGPTGGFLIGYFVIVFIIGFIANRKEKVSILMNSLALVAGNIVLYTFGIIWLKNQMSLTWEQAFASGLLPFVPGIFIKGIVIVVIAQAILPRVRQSLQPVGTKVG